MTQSPSRGLHSIPPSTRSPSRALPLVQFLLLGQVCALLNICASYRHPHPSTDVPAKDKGRWTPAPPDRYAHRSIINPPRHLSNVCLQAFARSPSLYNLARCTRASPSLL